MECTVAAPIHRFENAAALRVGRLPRNSDRSASGDQRRGCRHAGSGRPRNQLPSQLTRGVLQRVYVKVKHTVLQHVKVECDAGAGQELRPPERAIRRKIGAQFDVAARHTCGCSANGGNNRAVAACIRRTVNVSGSNIAAQEMSKHFAEESISGVLRMTVAVCCIHNELTTGR